MESTIKKVDNGFEVTFGEVVDVYVTLDEAIAKVKEQLAPVDAAATPEAKTDGADTAVAA